MLIDDFGMDTITLAGDLGGKLAAVRAAGFSQIMLSAADLVRHPGGWRAAVDEVRASGLRVTGFQVLRDFEGLSGHLHEYRVEIARHMLELCHAVGAPVLLVCSSTSQHAAADRDHLARDLRKLAMLATPLGVRIAYEALSWGRHVHQYVDAWDVVRRADCPNLGLAIDSYHLLATKSSLDDLDDIDVAKVFLVQLSDFLWTEVRSVEERIATARHLRVFPGEGVHTDTVAELVLRLDRAGYRGDYSFEVFNDDYQQLPPEQVAWRARRAADWLAEAVLRRGTPLPNEMRLRRLVRRRDLPAVST
jgi:sugar phosphate isomerase/epimerase